MKVLFLCNRVPFPPHDGGAILMYDLVRNLASMQAEVTVLAMNTPKHYQPEGVLPDKIRLVTVPVNTNLSVFKALVNLFKAVPYNFERFFSRAYGIRLRELLQAESFDLIQVEGSQLAWYLPIIRRHSQAPVVLRSHNVEYTIWDRLASHEKHLVKKIYFRILARRIKAFEKTWLPLFDAIAAISCEDKQRIRALGVRTPVKVIPAGVQRDRLVARPGLVARPKTLFLIGSLNWQPNLEGIAWFLNKVWPALQVRYPELEVHIAGSFQPDFWQRRPMHQVRFHGFVADAALFMQQYELMLIPLLSGGGMRVKLIEGLALGKAVLTTSVGAEGVQGQAGQHYLVADDAASWIRILSDYAEAKWQPGAFAKAAGKLVDELYDNKVVVKQHVKLYQEVILAKAAAGANFLDVNGYI